MFSTAMEMDSYKKSYNKNEILFDINGRGLIENLKFANVIPSVKVENAINAEIEKVRLHF